MRRILRLIDVLEALFPVDVRKDAVVLPALPQFIQVKQVISAILPVVDIRYEACGYTLRIKQDTVWILQHIKFQLQQLIANMLRKAGANQ